MTEEELKELAKKSYKADLEYQILKNESLRLDIKLKEAELKRQG